MSNTRAAITGIAGFLPEKVLTNQDLEKMVDTTDEWITSRTGIKERRILKDGLGPSDMAAPAIEALLEKTRTTKDEVDLILFATVTPDLVFPATANITADKVGIKNAFGFDINAACSGFMYALNTGAKYIETGNCKKVIVAGFDKMSSIIDYKDRTTCVIFGDGGGAVMLEPSTEGNGIIDAVLKSDGAGRHHLHQKAGGSVKPPTAATIAAREHFVYQEGQPVFKSAVNNMADVSRQIMERNSLKPEDISYLIPHQANLRIIDATRRAMNLPEEKVTINIERYGNTTNGTIPLCLMEWEKEFKKGDNIVLAAFGGGFTWGSILLKWAY